MKLYYSPGACSMSPHIVLSEAGFSYEIERVDLKTKQTESGQDYLAIADKGSVPLLVLDNGEKLSEGAAIVQYLADQKPAAKLAPASGTLERARVQEWLNYTASEFHKAYIPLFNPASSQEAKDGALTSVKKAYDYVSKKLEGKSFLLGEQFTVADAYLFTVINWHNFIGLELKAWPVLVAYQARVAARPAVQKAMMEEGLLDKKAA